MIGSIYPSFNPPGNVQDLTPSQQAGWSDRINTWIEKGKKGRTVAEYKGQYYEVLNNAPRPQFFNPTKTKKASDFAEKEVSWIAFPRQVQISSPTDEARWKRADSSRKYQDEYCEWSVKRNDDGKITSVTFTAEGPEYWEYLGETNPKKVVELYQKFISPEVKREDLFDASGKYIPRNRWNQDTKNGAMHLIQINNTLYAEIELAAGASMVREKDGRILTGTRELIDCGAYGAAERNSDPFIGAAVNELSRAGAMVSLKDPVGLYIGEFKPVGWETPDRSDPKNYWRILRGEPGTALRAVYEVPEDKDFVVGDIKINGKPIAYGAQITDFLEIKLTGIAQNIDTANVEPFGCVSYRPIGPLSSPGGLELTSASSGGTPVAYAPLSLRSDTEGSSTGGSVTSVISEKQKKEAKISLRAAPKISEAIDE